MVVKELLKDLGLNFKENGKIDFEGWSFSGRTGFLYSSDGGSIPPQPTRFCSRGAMD